MTLLPAIILWDAPEFAVSNGRGIPRRGAVARSQGVPQAPPPPLAVIPT